MCISFKNIVENYYIHYITGSSAIPPLGLSTPISYQCIEDCYISKGTGLLFYVNSDLFANNPLNYWAFKALAISYTV